MRATTTALPPLRYLSSADVDAAMPPLEEQLDLAADALVALAGGLAEMPPKIGVHPRTGALLHAMPAWLRDLDLVGLKWVSAFPANNTLGIPAISGLMVLNDAETGVPLCVMDAARITAVRTAAVSGVALQTFAPDAPSAVALIGAGVQARSHVAVLAALAPDAALRIHDRHEDRAEAVAKLARAAGIARARAAPSPREACDGADIVITVASLGSGSQMLALDWLLPTALVVAVDFATYASAELARTAARFVVDDRAQFLAYRDAGHFDGYPDPGGVLGEELVTAVEALGALEGPRGAPTGRVLVTHLGVGLADVVFADAIRKVAEGRGIGIELER